MPLPFTRIAILGGGGFLASHLIDLLSRRYPRATLVAVDIAPPPLDAPDGRAVRHWGVDLARTDDVIACVRGAEVLINTVGYISFSRREAAKLFRVNAELPLEAVRVCRGAGIPWLVHVSSVAALGYATARDAPVDEGFQFDWSAARRKRKYYMLSKAEGDRCLALCGSTIHRTVVLPGMMLGPGDPQSTPKLLNGLRTPVSIAPPGGQNVVDVRDVADGILAILERRATGEHFVLGGENLSYTELFARIRRAIGRTGPVVGLPHWTRSMLAVLARLAEAVASRPIALTHDNIDSVFEWRAHSSAKARRLLGYEPKRPLEMMIHDYVEHARVR